MKAYITLGTTGRDVFEVRDTLKEVLGKPVELRTADKSDFSATEFSISVGTKQEAKKLIEQAFDWLTKQEWYRDDSKVSFAQSGLVDDDGLDWTCDFCGGDIDECDCEEGKPG